MDERVTAVVEIVAKHHGVAPRRIGAAHCDEIRRLVAGLIAFEDERLKECAVDATARSSAYAWRAQKKLDTSLRTLQKLPPEWWRWAEADRASVLEAVQTLRVLCKAISKGPRRKTPQRAFAQRMAMQAAERVCDVCDVPTKGSIFLRIGAALFGEPTAVGAMEKYKPASFPVAVIADEVACLWPEGPRQGRSAKPRQK